MNSDVEPPQALIFLVLPDPGQLDRLCLNLEAEGYCPRAALDVPRLRQLLADHGRPDLFVVDSGLVDEAGASLAWSLRWHRQTAAAWLAMVDSGRRKDLAEQAFVDGWATMHELVTGFPKLVRKLLARAAVLPQPPGWIRQALQRASKQQRASGVGGLTLIERRLLDTLIGQLDRAVSRDLLLDQVWGYRENVRTRTVDTHIKRLRQKLGPAAGRRILTVRGFGYRIRD